MMREFLGVEVKLVVGYFDLIIVDDFLFENVVMVLQVVILCGEVKRCKIVQEISSEMFKIVVIQSSIMFLGNYIFDVKVKFIEVI